MNNYSLTRELVCINEKGDLEIWDIGIKNDVLLWRVEKNSKYMHVPAFNIEALGREVLGYLYDS